MTAYQKCDHPGRPCPRIYQAEPAITPVRFATQLAVGALMWFGILAAIAAAVTR